MTFVGLPYRWGGDDPIEGYDCSGLVIELLQSAGELPRNYDNTAHGIFNDFQNNSEHNIRDFGSLYFFGKSFSKITHITFGMDKIRMLEAGGGNSRTTSPKTAADQNAYIRIRPITWRRDLLYVLRPHYKMLKRSNSL